ncbi:unnamed protein product [Effrenium voratum]|nr:unnamed protein product [Effrenium voratum]
MKSGVRPEGIMAQSPFKEAMEGIADACAKVLKNDESTPGASVTALVPGDDNQVLSQFLDSDQLKSLAGEEDKAEQLRTWAKAALCQVDRFVKLVVEPPTHQLLAEVLKTTVLCEDDQRNDCASCAKATSLRVGWRTVEPSLLSVAVLESVAQTCFMVFGHVAPIQKAFLTPGGERWSTMTKVSFTWVMYEGSVQKDRNRGFINLAEQCHCFTVSPVALTKRNRQHFKGSTHALAITDVQARDHSTKWKLPKSDKTALLGPSGKILAGGGLGQVEPAQEFSDGEPVAWHSMKERVYEEVLHSWQCKKVLDGSTLDDTFALAALKQNVVYVGVVWSEQHKEFLHQRLVKRVWDSYMDPDSPLYQIGLAELLKAPEAELAEEGGGGKRPLTDNKEVDDGDLEQAPSIAKREVWC